MSFPYVSTTPVNEFDTTSKLFCIAFPWLFPGGYGDINDYSEIKETPDEWMKRLLYYQDGRFAEDKMWSFFALNYTVRKKMLTQVLTSLMASLKMGQKQSLNCNTRLKMVIQVG